MQRRLAPTLSPCVVEDGKVGSAGDVNCITYITPFHSGPKLCSRSISLAVESLAAPLRLGTAHPRVNTQQPCPSRFVSFRHGSRRFILTVSSCRRTGRTRRQGADGSVGSPSVGWTAGLEPRGPKCVLRSNGALPSPSAGLELRCLWRKSVSKQSFLELEVPDNNKH